MDHNLPFDVGFATAWLPGRLLWVGQRHPGGLPARPGEDAQILDIGRLLRCQRRKRGLDSARPRPAIFVLLGSACDSISPAFGDAIGQAAASLFDETLTV
jgi:hypothetical protein